MEDIDQESLIKLGTCESEIQRLFLLVSKFLRFKVLDGFSSTNYLSDKHFEFPAKAIDVLFLDEALQFSVEAKYYFFGGFVMGIASQLGIAIKWGPCLSDFSEHNFYGSFVHFEV